MRTPILTITRQKLATLTIAILVLPLLISLAPVNVLAQVKQETPVSQARACQGRAADTRKNSNPSSRPARDRSPLAAMSLTTTHSRARSSCIPRVGTTSRKTPTKTTRTSPPKPACFTSPTSNRTIKAKPRPLTFLYNGGPGSSTVWLHMGAFGPKRVVTANDTPHSRRAHIPWSTTNTACSTSTRSGLRRRARHRLQPHRRKGQGESLLRRRPGCVGVRRFHFTVPLQVWTLEFAEIFIRRELRYHAIRRRQQYSGNRTRRRLQRRDSSIANLKLLARFGFP